MIQRFDADLILNFTLEITFNPNLSNSFEILLGCMDAEYCVFVALH